MTSILGRIVLFTICVMLSGLSATAQDTSLERLDTWGRNRGWEGVGLLNIAGKATCTAVMIRPDLVLTAAHCLYDADNKRQYDPIKIEFRAGWRDGKAVARRFGKHALIHSDYQNGGGLSAKQIRNDVALLQLSDPILSTHADPFRQDGGLKRGVEVSVVSYGKGRNDVPSRQRSCKVLDVNRGVIAMSCDVVPGSSGAPVFSMNSGRPRIVSLVSALGLVDGKQVSYGMDIRAPLAEVLQDFRSGDRVFPKTVTTARRLTVGGVHKAGGARFLRP
ncbi:MAG: trypsin-like serine peptidase [Paracoccaceae bacterium]